MYVDIYQAILDNIHPASFVDVEPPMPTLWELFLMSVRGLFDAYSSGPA